jgi:hypothetical protein
MRKTFKLSIGLIVIAMLAISGCSKDSSLNSDPADEFVGSYTYTMTAPALGTQTGNLTITKTATNKISMLTTGGTPTPYTVSGNIIKEDANQTVNIPVSATGTASFTETSTGIINGKVITINGEWANSGYTTLTFKVVATKK